MPPSSLDPRGLLGTTVTGYELAWTHRRALLPVLLPVLAPMLLGLLALDLATSRDDMAIVNGALVVGSDGTAGSWVKLGLTVGAWLLALTAGALTVAGGLRGSAVRPVKALALACRRFPVLALGLGALTGAAFLAVWGAAALVASIEGRLGIVLLLGVLVVVGMASARMVLGVLTWLCGGSAWHLTRGRVLGTAGAFLLGGVAAPLLSAYALNRIWDAVGWSGLREIGDAVLLTGALCVQSAILAYAYLQRRDETRSGEEVLDLAVVDARLAELAGPPSRWAWVAAGAMVVPVLLSAGVAVANPYGAPAMRSHGDGPAGGALAVAWPVGQHPVIVGNTGVRFCDNDLCDRYLTRNGGPAVMDDRGAVDVGPDGTVVTAVVSGGESNGGPFVHYGRCTRRDGCRQAWVPVRASAAEPFGWPEVAVASALDGAVWFVLAMPSPDDRPGDPVYRITFIRCAEPTCARPERHAAGTMERTPADGHPDGLRARLSIGPDGRPVAAFWVGMGIHLITCEPVTCARPRRGHASAGPPDTRWSTLGGVDDGVVVLGRGALQIGEQTSPLAGDMAEESGGLAVTDTGIYASAAVPAPGPSGFRVWIGERPEYWRRVLWRCDRPDCARLRRLPLDEYEGPARPERLAVGPDRRVLIVREDRVALVELPAAT